MIATPPLPAMPRQRPLPASFYLRPTLLVARELLGAVFARVLDGRRCSGRIVEVEAYHQDGDPASHSFRGCTQRNEVMFRRGGCLYVYFTYGMHFCMNVVTEAAGIGAAVLIRAVEPLEGIEDMARRRGRPVPPHALTNGPAKCCQAFAVDRSLNGVPLRGPELLLLPGDPVPESSVAVTPRVGISSGAGLPWRFVVRDSAWVSKKR